MERPFLLMGMTAGVLFTSLLAGALIVVTLLVTADIIQF